MLSDVLAYAGAFALSCALVCGAIALLTYAKWTEEP